MRKSISTSLGNGVLAVVMCVAAIPAIASDGAIDVDQRVDRILTQQQKIRVDAQNERGGWDSIPAEKRGELVRRQDRLFALLEGKQTIGDLSANDQVEVANDLEWIKALTENAEDERVVCTRERVVGSMRTTTRCRSVAEMRKEREQSKDALTHATRLQNIAPKGPSGSL